MKKTAAVSVINQHGHAFVLYNIALSEDQIRVIDTGKEKKVGSKDYVLFKEEDLFFLDDNESDFPLTDLLNVSKEEVDIVDFLQNFNEEVRYIVGEQGNWAALHYNANDEIDYEKFHGIFNYYEQMKEYVMNNFKASSFEIEKRDLPHVRKLKGDWVFYNWKGVSQDQIDKNSDLYALINQPINNW